MSLLSSFNSTTVQLIRIAETGDFTGGTSFNSTTVQLILKKFCIKWAQEIGFNSTTVQLIPQVDQGRGTPTGFQFHNGTINT